MEAIGKLEAVIGLDASDGEREEVNQPLEELNGTVAANLIEDHLKLHTAILVNGGILIELLSRQGSRKAYLGHMLYVYLNALATTFHTLIGLW